MKEVTTEEWHAIREVLGHLRTMELAKLEKKVIQLEDQLAEAQVEIDHLCYDKAKAETVIGTLEEVNADIHGTYTTATPSRRTPSQGGENEL